MDRHSNESKTRTTMSAHILPPQKSNEERSNYNIVNKLKEKVLPRMLAPYLSSSGFRVGFLHTHSWPLALLRKQKHHGYVLSLPLRVGSGQFARLLLSLEIRAVSKALSPESNDNSPSSVAGTVVQYTTVQTVIDQTME